MTEGYNNQKEMRGTVQHNAALLVKPQLGKCVKLETIRVMRVLKKKKKTAVKMHPQGEFYCLRWTFGRRESIQEEEQQMQRLRARCQFAQATIKKYTDCGFKTTQFYSSGGW